MGPVGRAQGTWGPSLRPIPVERVEARPGRRSAPCPVPDARRRVRRGCPPGATLRVIHGWSPSPASGYPVPSGTGQLAQVASEPADVLRPWRAKFPGVEVSEQAVVGSPAGHLVDASAHAALVVVGRFTHGPRPGPRIGPVTHSVPHHSTAPVAMTAHS
ncbi:universal stress protein [Streptomyces indonesiensis]